MEWYRRYTVWRKVDGVTTFVGACKFRENADELAALHQGWVVDESAG